MEEAERFAWAESRISRYILRCIKICSSYIEKLLAIVFNDAQIGFLDNR